MSNPSLAHWLSLSDKDKLDIFQQLSQLTGLPPAVLEKDWWVAQTLMLTFSIPIGQHMVFKGGTSLSKAWGLIDRFSEDIDLALDQRYLGFDKDKAMTSSQVTKLRKRSFEFINGNLHPALIKSFTDAGLSNATLQLGEVRDHDQDPLTIQVLYTPLTAQLQYIQPQVLIEIGSRSLQEPYTLRGISSILGETMKGMPFADMPFDIPTVNPERTFLEKIFLLHEEFQKAVEKIRINRLSRHHTDLEKIMDTPYADKAFESGDLYNTIVEHRRTMNALRGIDYANHTTDKINIIPPLEIQPEWKKDYEAMQESMIQGDSISYEELMTRMQSLKDRVNQLKF